MQQRAPEADNGALWNIPQKVWNEIWQNFKQIYLHCQYCIWKVQAIAGWRSIHMQGIVWINVLQIISYYDSFLKVLADFIFHKFYDELYQTTMEQCRYSDGENIIVAVLSAPPWAGLIKCYNQVLADATYWCN